MNRLTSFSFRPFLLHFCKKKTRINSSLSLWFLVCCFHPTCVIFCDCFDCKQNSNLQSNSDHETDDSILQDTCDHICNTGNRCYSHCIWKLRGYMIYEFVCESDVNYTLNRIEVKEFAYEDGKVLQTLLGFLRNQSDLARTVVIRTGEEDFYHILPSAQDTSGNYIDFGFLQTNIGAIGTMYKIVDLEGFITASSHRKFIPVNLSTGFDYYDELAHSEKTFNIAFETDESGKTARWHVIPKDAPCDARVKCNLADLSALLMGSCRLASLLRLGGAEISDDAYADMLDSLLCCKQKPWTNTDY